MIQFVRVNVYTLAYLAKEWTVRPWRKSPTIVIVKPFTVPISSLIVNTSNNACVGCSPMPSPALIRGFLQCRAALWNYTWFYNFYDYKSLWKVQKFTIDSLTIMCTKTTRHHFLNRQLNKTKNIFGPECV